jgi:beta-glucosidase
MDGIRISYGDWNNQQTLDGNAGRPDDAVKQSHAVVQLRRSAKEASADALQLTWRDTWFSTLRADSPALDLRPSSSTAPTTMS